MTSLLALLLESSPFFEVPADETPDSEVGTAVLVGNAVVGETVGEAVGSAVGDAVNVGALVVGEKVGPAGAVDGEADGVVVITAEGTIVGNAVGAFVTTGAFNTNEFEILTVDREFAQPPLIWKTKRKILK